MQVAQHDTGITRQGRGKTDPHVVSHAASPQHVHGNTAPRPGATAPPRDVVVEHTAMTTRPVCSIADTPRAGRGHAGNPTRCSAVNGGVPWCRVHHGGHREPLLSRDLDENDA